MRRHPWFKKLPTPHELMESRFLKPFRPHLDHHSLWQFNRRAVAGGVAVGLFFGILVPFAQILLAAFAAILLRVNLPVAAFSTLVTNPFTFPPIYYLAYKLGDLLTGFRTSIPEAVIESDIRKTVAVQGDVTSWLDSLFGWLQTVGLPLAVGLAVLAVISAVLGYFLVDVVWRWQIARRWRIRHQRRHR